MEYKSNKSSLIKKNCTRQGHLEPLHGDVFSSENCALQMTT